MPHADAALFPPDIPKTEAYEIALQQLAALCEDQRNWVSNLANTSSLLWAFFHSRKEPLNKVNWSGFYVRSDLFLQSKSTAGRPSSDDQLRLLLAPFAGLPACQFIDLTDKNSKRLPGVCATAYLTGETQMVPDVEKRPGHIACDGKTRSEIVVPMRDSDNRLVGVLDIDCEVENGFDEIDQDGLERVSKLVGGACDWF